MDYVSHLLPPFAFECVNSVTIAFTQHEYQIFNYDQLEMTQDEHLNVGSIGCDCVPHVWLSITTPCSIPVKS